MQPFHRSNSDMRYAQARTERCKQRRQATNIYIELNVIELNWMNCASVRRHWKRNSSASYTQQPIDTQIAKSDD